MLASLSGADRMSSFVMEQKMRLLFISLEIEVGPI